MSNLTSRRSFLRGAAAFGLAGGTAGLLADKAFAEIGGNLNAPGAGGVNGGPYNVLEIFLKGGLSPWETLWVDPNLPASLTHLSEAANLNWNTLVSDGGTVSTDFIDQTPLGVADFAKYPLTGGINLGPSCTPLVYADLVKHTRVIAVQHELLPHPAAIPYSLSGSRLGRPQRSGLGAAISRRHHPGGPTGKPASIILHDHADDFLEHALATGFHGAAHTPLAIRVGDGTFADSLLRSAHATPAEDHLRTLFRNDYDGLLTHATGRVRAPHFDAYDASLGYLLRAEADLYPLFNGLPLTYPADLTYADGQTTTAILAAFDLLADAAVHYTCVIDQGLNKTYDSHDNTVNSPQKHAEVQCCNLWSVMYALAQAKIAGTFDPTNTLVFINTEFGRKEKNGGNGSEHNPYGYVNMLIGPNAASLAGTAVGTIDTNARAGGDYTTTAVRAAVALAAGIDPWQDDMYDIAMCGNALTAGMSEQQRNDVLRTQILGVS